MKNSSRNGLGRYIFSSLALYFNNVHNARLVLQGKTAVTFFFFFPQKQKYFFRKKTQTKQTQNNNKKPNPNTTPTPISPFIYIHYLVTLEQSLEESHVCAVHTLRHYLGPWQ